MEKLIKITCESSGLKSIEEIEAFQGDLKTIDDEDFKKLKKSIIKYGFSFPIFLWRDNILDGHQRLKAVTSLIEDGYKLDGNLLPVDYIEAKDRKEAAEKLLLINSRYAKIDQSGFDLFVEDFEIDIADMSGLLEIPEIEISLPETGETSYEDEWQDMPEFENENLDVYKTIKVHFQSKENFDEFQKLIAQEISDEAKFIYHPKLIREDLKALEYGTDS